MYSTLAKKVIDGYRISDEEALRLLHADDKDVLALVHAAYQIRYHFFQNKVKLNMIMNVKSGLCPEDCGYCSQAVDSTAPISKYTMLDANSIVAGAQEAQRRKAGTFCIVASGRGPSEKELNEVLNAVETIKATSTLKICACLGQLKDEQAQRLKEAGVDRYNHNLNTHVDNYKEICSTHTYDDRVETVNKSKSSGMSPCSGVIFGMGETKEQQVEIAQMLHELDVDSIPCNFLVPIAGTKLAGRNDLTPVQCLKILAMMRFKNPTKEIRVSGGREFHLRSLQSLGLYIANSIFVGDYLTTEGQLPHADWEMIQDLGFEIEENAFAAV